MTLVSCIMPTRGRREYAKRAVDCFRKQTYPQKELVILDDSEDPSFDEGEFNRDGILYVRHVERLTIPQKRNRCVELSSGDIIMHFDSDDWSASRRMEDQVSRLLNSGKAVTGYYSMLFWDDDRSKAVFYSGYSGNAIGTSLAFFNEWWKAHPFVSPPGKPNVGEDTIFSKQAKEANELTTEPAGAMMVARIHSGNTSPKKFDVSSTSYSHIPLDRIPAEFFGMLKK